MGSYIISFVKITEKLEYAEDFISGNIYCNTWEYFDKEEKKERGDHTELTEAILRTQILTRDKLYSVRLVNNDTRFTPVYCMTSILSKKYDKPQFIKFSDNRFKDFGKYTIIITDIKEFLNRLQQQQPDFCFAPVEYIDFGNLRSKVISKPIIKKDKLLFGYQQEFRIYNQSIALTTDKDFDVPGIQKISKTAENFFIGGLKDIAIIYETDKLFRGVKVDLKIDWDYCHKKNLIKDR